MIMREKKNLSIYNIQLVVAVYTINAFNYTDAFWFCNIYSDVIFADNIQNHIKLKLSIFIRQKNYFTVHFGNCLYVHYTNILNDLSTEKKNKHI